MPFQGVEDSLMPELQTLSDDPGLQTGRSDFELADMNRQLNLHGAESHTRYLESLAESLSRQFKHQKVKFHACRI